MLDEVKEEKNSTDFKRLVCLKSDGTILNFNVFKCSLDFASDIYNGKISLEKAKKSQNKMLQLLDHLKKYNSTKLGNIKSREKTLNDVENLYKNKSNVIKTFENGVFSCNYGFQKEKPDMPDKALPNWVKVSKKRFDTIKNGVQNTKRDNLQGRPQRGNNINFDNSNKLIQVHGNIADEEALNKMADINENFTKITIQKFFNPNQTKVVNIHFMVSEIFTEILKNLWKIMKVSSMLLNQKVIILMNKRNQT